MVLTLSGDQKFYALGEEWLPWADPEHVLWNWQNWRNSNGRQNHGQNVAGSSSWSDSTVGSGRSSSCKGIIKMFCCW